MAVSPILTKGGKNPIERRAKLMVVIEIIGAVAAIITIFSAGVVVGRYISKNDRPAQGTGHF